MLSSEDLQKLKIEFLNKKHCANLKNYAYFKKALYEANPEGRNLIKNKLKYLEGEIASYYEICRDKLNREECKKS
jgi:hypothetical protein